jgi:hypothetical protein
MITNYHLTENNWKNEKERRKFFDNLARSKDFDPLDARKWYTITHKDVVQMVINFFIFLLFVSKLTPFREELVC